MRDVDALAAALVPGHFDIVGAPADLELSPAIRAMQLVGPAGEMLYLTQVKAPVPPFALPLSRELPPAQAIGPLFIAVLSTPSREAVLRAIAPLSPLSTLCFDTKVTVLNRALGRALEARQCAGRAAGRAGVGDDECAGRQRTIARDLARRMAGDAVTATNNARPVYARRMKTPVPPRAGQRVKLRRNLHGLQWVAMQSFP